MLCSKGFDLWADGYDKSVGLSDADGTYPFAGYKDVLNEIYNNVLSRGGTVLDIGFGTGTLTSKLYEKGCKIYGQDFSGRMIDVARKKMPNAKLYQGDFSAGLAAELTDCKYDAIIATYSLHHLTDNQKVGLLSALLKLLNDGGSIYIGDVAFACRRELDSCRAQAGEEWDDEEIYFVYDELKKYFPQTEFKRISFCSGVFCLKNQF